MYMYHTKSGKAVLMSMHAFPYPPFLGSRTCLKIHSLWDSNKLHDNELILKACMCMQSSHEWHSAGMTAIKLTPYH